MDDLTLTGLPSPSLAVTGRGEKDVQPEHLKFPCGVCAQTLEVDMMAGESRWVLCPGDGARHRLWNTPTTLYIHCAEDCDLCLDNAHGRTGRFGLEGAPPIRQ